MRQKAFIKLEKKLACDLKPGELFTSEESAHEYMHGEEIAVTAFIRSNLPAEDVDDGDTIVYKIHIVITDPEDPAPPRVDPHAPPGVSR
jgi:hypothetical protein